MLSIRQYDAINVISNASTCRHFAHCGSPSQSWPSQVGVAMSLFVLLDPLINDDDFKAHCVFYMALMAFSTVLINGTTAKYVLEGLGLLSMTPQQLDVLQYVLKVGAPAFSAWQAYASSLLRLLELHFIRPAGSCYCWCCKHE